VPQARADLYELDFKIERLSAALQALKARHEAAIVQAREAARQAQIALVREERDRVAEELAATYPRLAATLADLLGGVRACDQKAAALGLERVEALARGIPGNGYVNGSPAPWLVNSVRLPAWDPMEGIHGRDLWPPPPPATNPHAQMRAAAIGDEARRVGKVVADRKAEEAGLATRRVH
jgi:hypothetical protein